tara:strand:- start:143 stop:844 length:702 start_codon:yes stop_codon:yes gene_type:complete
MFLNLIKNYTPKFFYNFLKVFYHIFRFYRLINPKYSTSENIIFGNKDSGDFIKKEISKAKNYLEFGSGNTTIFATQNNINFYSIESDRNFFYYLTNKKNIKNIYFYSLGLVQFYSYPLFKSNIFKIYYRSRAKIYVSKIFEVLTTKMIMPDLVLVDGRYRVACMLNIFLYLKKNNLINTCVILDDFKHREHYQIINSFFNISLVGRLGVCYINDKAQTSEINNLIEKYLEDPR